MTDTRVRAGTDVVPALVEHVRVEVVRDWAAAGGGFDAFAGVALSALRSGLRRWCPTASDLVDWTFAVDELPLQARLDESFGQPPLTLYRDDQFRVDALFWAHGSTAVHDHAFAGAFGVLHGRSVQTRYMFRESARTDPAFRIGRLDVCDAELLAPGDVREIPHGERLIHSVVHVDRPTVSIVVRTPRQPSPDPEAVYFAPGIAVDPARSDQLRTRRVQLVRMMLRTGDRARVERTSRLIERCDAHTAFLIALEFGSHPGGIEDLPQVLARCERRWSTGLAELFADAVATEARRRTGATLLRDEPDSGCRLVLAALVALEDPDLLAKVVGADPSSGDTMDLFRYTARRVDGGDTTASTAAPRYRHPVLAPLGALDRRTE